MLTKRLAPLILALALSACSTVAANLDNDTEYKFDISLNVNGFYTKNRGAMVVPKAPSYLIKGTVKGGFDFLLIKSCHRNEPFENKGEEFTYVYKPTPGIEDNRACPLEILGAEKVKGRHSGAFIDFENEHDTLPGSGDCDGNHIDWNGVGVCQGPVGLFQRIVFQVPVVAETVTPGCEVPPSSDERTFVFKIGLGRCLIKFMEKAKPNRTFRLNTRGYEAITPRDF